jgi:hypothetical protein
LSKKWSKVNILAFSKVSSLEAPSKHTITMLSSNPVVQLSRTNTSRSQFFACREPLWKQKLVAQWL